METVEPAQHKAATIRPTRAQAAAEAWTRLAGSIALLLLFALAPPVGERQWVMLAIGGVVVGIVTFGFLIQRRRRRPVRIDEHGIHNGGLFIPWSSIGAVVLDTHLLSRRVKLVMPVPVYVLAPRAGWLFRDPAFAKKAALIRGFWLEFRGDDWGPPPPPRRPPPPS